MSRKLPEEARNTDRFVRKIIDISQYPVILFVLQGAAIYIHTIQNLNKISYISRKYIVSGEKKW